MKKKKLLKSIHESLIALEARGLTFEIFNIGLSEQVSEILDKLTVVETSLNKRKRGSNEIYKSVFNL